MSAHRRALWAGCLILSLSTPVFAEYRVIQEVPAKPPTPSSNHLEQISDGWITAKLKSTFAVSPKVQLRHVEVETQQGVVTLTGVVKTNADRDYAETVANKLRGVKAVRNNLAVVASWGH